MTYVLLVPRAACKHRLVEAPGPGVTVVFLTALVLAQGRGGGGKLGVRRGFHVAIGGGYVVREYGFLLAWGPAVMLAQARGRRYTQFIWREGTTVAMFQCFKGDEAPRPLCRFLVALWSGSAVDCKEGIPCIVLITLASTAHTDRAHARTHTHAQP